MSLRDDELPTALSPTTSALSTTARTWRLSVVEGPDTAAAFVVDGGATSRVLLGQSPACAVRVSDRQVSRRHAALDASGAQLRVTDLGSTNGTAINGVTIVDGFVADGDVLRVGTTAMRIELVGTTIVPVARATSFGRIVGASLEMRRLYPLCARLAASDVPVIVEGETGTGKEVLAESLHEAGARASGPFIVFDCTAVAPNLIESELFGHERGAFTGAVATRRGVFEQAQGGTLLIDEIGDLDLTLQPKLLRALERSEIRRVGGDRSIAIDVRVIAATRRDLDREVQDGRFRDDLFFRLAVARIELPPLRARRGDVGVLTEHLWRELGGRDVPIPADLVQRFERYPWPGNVRELANAVARHLALGDLVHPIDRPESAGHSGDAFEEVLAKQLPFPRARQEVVARFERRYIERVLSAHGGSVAAAARASGIARRYFNLIAARRR